MEVIVFIIDMLFPSQGETTLWQRSSTPGTLEASIAAVAITGAAALIGFVLRAIWRGGLALLDKHRRFKAALVRLHNDIVIWRTDFAQTFKEDDIIATVRMIRRAKADLRLSTPSTDSLDEARMEEFLHWLPVDTMRLVRTFIVYFDLVQTIAADLDTEAFAAMTRTRKISAFGLLYHHALFLDQIGREAETKLKRYTGIRPGDRLSANIGRFLDDAGRTSRAVIGRAGEGGDEPSNHDSGKADQRRHTPFSIAFRYGDPQGA